MCIRTCTWCRGGKLIWTKAAHACACAPVYACECVLPHRHVHIHIYICTYNCTYVYTYTYTCTYTHTYAHTTIYTYTHTYIYNYTCICINIYQCQCLYVIVLIPVIAYGPVVVCSYTYLMTRICMRTIILTCIVCC